VIDDSWIKGTALSKLTSLELHLAERVAKDRGISREYALDIVKASLHQRQLEEKSERAARTLSRRNAKPRVKKAGAPTIAIPAPEDTKKALTKRQKIAKRLGLHYDKDDLRRCWNTVQGGAPGLGRRS